MRQLCSNSQNVCLSCFKSRLFCSSGVLVNWCPVIVSNRQQVSPILSLAVIRLLIDQWDDLLHLKFSVGCKLLDKYDILFILITQGEFCEKTNTHWNTGFLPQIWLILFYLKLSWIIRSIVRAIFTLFRVTSLRSRLSRDSRWRSGFWPSRSLDR